MRKKYSNVCSKRFIQAVLLIKLVVSRCHRIKQIESNIHYGFRGELISGFMFYIPSIFQNDQGGSFSFVIRICGLKAKDICFYLRNFAIALNSGRLRII